MVSSSRNNIGSNKDDDNELKLVYGHKLSSVGPANVTGELSYEPSNIDLAMKLHYIRVVYMFDSQAAEGFTIPKLKAGTFAWLCYYYESCGRFRQSESGRPYIKCNDCGMRFVEAKSTLTIDEWLQMKDTSPQRLLVSDHIIGPDLIFSPPVFLQVTSFKCGGMALGLSFAHVLGDAFSLVHYMNLFSQVLNGHQPNDTPSYNKSPLNNHESTKLATSGPLSFEKTGPVGDHWAIATPCEMRTFSFHVTAAQLAQLQMEVSGTKQTPSPVQPFEALCAVIWRGVAKVKSGPKPNTVTVIKPAIDGPKAEDMVLRNSQVVGSVKAHFSVVEAHPKELAELIHNWAQDERAQLEEMVGRDPEGSDLVVYGSNLTFVDLGETDFYGFELNGLRPRLVNCFVDSIGGEGVVLVLPGPKNDNNGRNVKSADDGKIVTLILPNSYMEQVEQELKNEWALFI